MPNRAYHLFLPSRRTTSIIFSSPHSGRDYPVSFLQDSQLDARVIRSSEDAFVDLLFADAPTYGAPLLAARAPRAYVDMNRSVDELDPALIAGIESRSHNPRVSSGLGVIPRVVSNGREIYSGKISPEQANIRLQRHWYPYHHRLQDLIDDNMRDFGMSILIDCHSMPHEAIANVTRVGQPRPEVVLGDRFGASAGNDITDQVEAAFRRSGLRVARNAPFAGAYITQHYGRPSRRQHAVQVEIDRSLYMNEHMVRPNGNFRNFQRVISQVMRDICQIGLPDLRVAAE